MNEIRFIDLFSGIGGFRRGLELSGGYRCIWSCDINKYANQVYKARFGEENHNSGDVRGVDPRDIPDFDLLCAGFPCQSFSLAGKRQGFQDTRGTLFYEISRIAEAKRPKMLLLENVKGLLSNDRGQTFHTILQELGRIGYWAEWQIFYSKHHGVPQNRERVFIVGHIRNGSTRSLFPIAETDEMADEDGGGRSSVQAEVSTAIDGSYYKGIDRHGQRTGVLDAFNRRTKEGEAYSLKTNHSPTSSAVLAILTDNLGGNIKDRIKDADKAPAWTLGGSSTKVAISFTNPHDSEEDRRVNIGDISRAVKPYCGNQQPLVLADRTRIYADLGRNLELPKEITNALSSVQKDNLILENFRIRRLTPVECERLQGFPDNWTKYGFLKGNTIAEEKIYGWRWLQEKDPESGELLVYPDGEPVMENRYVFVGKKKLDAPLFDTARISDTQRYRALGNAVTTNVITFLGHKIMEAWS